MKKYLVISVIVIIVGVIFFIWSKNYFVQPFNNVQDIPIQDEKQMLPNDIISPEVPNISDAKSRDFQSPLERANERVIKKYFGIFITQQNSPIQPERFYGYHTGTDFEIFPEERDAPVVVKAICTGQVLVKRSATGYGGVVVQSCDVNGQPVTVIYGHMKLASISQKIGDHVDMGEEIGVLGSDKSIETGGERKHLHLGIHKGTGINIMGYVQKKNELDAWLDPCVYVCD
ncbi:MAG: M23 family metallopeptidase [Parcubacteria group bacterium]